MTRLYPPDLIAAINAAYEIFSIYPQPLKMDAAPTRDPEQILKTLSNTGLRELTGEQIGPYAGWALTTVGSASDYKHFLPRIMEQAVNAPEWMGTQPPIIASRLILAEWLSWPKAEQSTIVAIFIAAWRHEVTRHPDDDPYVSEWLCGLARLNQDIPSLLAEWLTKARAEPLLNIAELITEMSALLSFDPCEQIFWADVAPDIRAYIASWLTLPQIQTALSNAEGVSDNDKWRISKAQETIARYLQKNPN